MYYFYLFIFILKGIAILSELISRFEIAWIYYKWKCITLQTLNVLAFALRLYSCD